MRFKLTLQVQPHALGRELPLENVSNYLPFQIS